MSGRKLNMSCRRASKGVVLRGSDNTALVDFLFFATAQQCTSDFAPKCHSKFRVRCDFIQPKIHSAPTIDSVSDYEELPGLAFWLRVLVQNPHLRELLLLRTRGYVPLQMQTPAVETPRTCKTCVRRMAWRRPNRQRWIRAPRRHPTELQVVPVSMPLLREALE